MTRWQRYGLAALVALVLLAVAATCGYCARDRRAREDAAQAQAAARRASDEAALRASGAIVAERVSREAAQHAAEALADQIAALRAAAPTVEVREVTRWQTATVPASCPAAEPIVAGCGVPTRPCVLRVGDPVEVRGVEATVETASGARALVGSAEVWSGTRRIASAPFRDGRFSIAEADLPRANVPPRWAATAGYGWSSRGTVWLAGVERRIAGPAWVGVEGGVVGGEALVAARVRVEW
ncbi:MAG: hypothetical protein ABFD84_02435 [Candidatus Polarisedimenticolia bacterium]